jgi:hypothetical protein
MIFFFSSIAAVISGNAEIFLDFTNYKTDKNTQEHTTSKPTNKSRAFESKHNEYYFDYDKNQPIRCSSDSNHRTTSYDIPRLFGFHQD